MSARTFGRKLLQVCAVLFALSVVFWLSARAQIDATPPELDTPAPYDPAPDTPAPDTPAPDTPAPETADPDTGADEQDLPFEELVSGGVAEPTFFPSSKSTIGIGGGAGGAFSRRRTHRKEADVKKERSAVPDRRP